MALRCINGVELHVDRRGCGSPMVYVHGGFACLGRRLRDRPANTDDWRDEFAVAHAVVSYDRRGCGQSACPPSGYDLPTQAEDLADLVRRLRLDQVHLFASSAGAPIAILYAARCPEQVRSLIIQGSSLAILRPGDGVRERALAAYQLLRRHGQQTAFARRPAGVEIWFESPWGRRQAAADDRLPQYLDEEALLIRRAATRSTATRVGYYAAEVANIHAYHDYDLRPHAAAVRAPTLVLHGDRDRVFPLSAGRRLAAAIPRARFEVISGAGHGPIFTSASARARAIQFMANAA